MMPLPDDIQIVRPYTIGRAATAPSAPSYSLRVGRQAASTACRGEPFMSIPTSPCEAQQAVVPLLVGGRFERSASSRLGDVFNPSTGAVQARGPFCTAEEIDQAVRTAAAALPAWSETPAVERARVMFKFRELLQARFEDLAALVTREHGKTIAEARAEIQR